MPDQDGAPIADASDDYRLPKNVTPKRYEIRLTPDLSAFTFQGEVNIAVVVNDATDDVVLNALELEIDKVTADRGGKSLAAKTELEPAKERAHLRFAEKLSPGEWRLKIAFRGILNDKLHGFYRSQYQDASGKTHLAATTQFESTDARRAFPCWDEPELKASYKVTLVVDEHLAAISNGGQESERKLAGAKKEVVFKETIPMSTYLVAFIVGEFDATAPVDAGTPLRIVHVPGKESLTGWARQIGAFSLKYFADYYGLKYPGDKLDLIAIPDFASGAMENLGAITFRETALLADEKSASRAELERIADVVSHENAHMWFGDLVTMRWWNGIWLNEAFATFMEMLAVHAWKPQWKRWDSFSVSRAAAMSIDGLRSTRPIEYTVRSPEDCRAMFDILTYEKGAAVLRMLEQFLGANVFRDGIRLYLNKHQFNNTETGDLWDALESASRDPVRKVMDSWILQPGFPIIEAAPAANGSGLKLSQRRFFYLVEDNHQLWHVPVMVRAKTDQGVSTHKLLLATGETTLDIPGKLEWALLNEGGHGFYRVHYAPALLAAITKNLGALQPIERFGLVSDTWAATVAGLGPLSEFLKMARLFTGETDINVWRALIGAFAYLDMIASDADRPALAAAVREIVGPAAARLGWEPKSGESELVHQLRGTLIGALGTLGDDPQVHERARPVCALRGQSRFRGSRPDARAGEYPRVLRRRRALRGVQAKVQSAAHAAGRTALPVCAGKFPRSRSAEKNHGDDARRAGANPERAVPDAFAAAQPRLPLPGVGLCARALGRDDSEVSRQRDAADVRSRGRAPGSRRRGQEVLRRASRAARRQDYRSAPRAAERRGRLPPPRRRKPGCNAQGITNSTE